MGYLLEVCYPQALILWPFTVAGNIFLTGGNPTYVPEVQLAAEKET